MAISKTVRSFILLLIIPIILSILTAGCLYENAEFINNFEYLLGDFIGIMATLFGFVLTSLSILLAFEGNEKTKQLRDSRHYKTILGTHLISVVCMLIALILFFVFYTFRVINNITRFMFLMITLVTFIYLILSLFYLILMIITSFHKKPKYH